MQDVPKLDRPHLPADYRQALGGVEVEAAVFVEVDAAPGVDMDEACFVSALGETTPFVRAMVISMPLENGLDAVAADLEAYAAMPLARGVRRLIERYTDEPGWRRALRSWRRCGACRSTISVRSASSPPAARRRDRTRRACPKVRFVLDDIGKPGVREGIGEPWRTDIATLAREPNVAARSAW